MFRRRARIGDTGRQPWLIFLVKPVHLFVLSVFSVARLHRTAHVPQVSCSACQARAGLIASRIGLFCSYHASLFPSI